MPFGDVTTPMLGKTKREIVGKYIVTARELEQTEDEATVLTTGPTNKINQLSSESDPESEKEDFENLTNQPSHKEYIAEVKLFQVAPQTPSKSVKKIEKITPKETPSKSVKRIE